MQIVTTQFQNVQQSATFYFQGGDGKLRMKIADGLAVQVDASPGTAPAYDTSVAPTALCVLAPSTITLT